MEAFSIAADAKRFPEQLKYVQPWQAKRILWNGFVPGGNVAANTDMFRLDVGGFNPVLGKSYGEIAADSRSQHKSQGFGVARGRGEAIEFFKALAGDAPVNDLFDGVITDWTKIKGSEAITQSIQSTISAFDFLQPHKSVTNLVQVHKALQAMPDSYWREQKQKEVKDLVVSASGLWMEAVTTLPSVVQGDSLQMNVIVNDRSGTGITLKRVQVEGFDTTMSSLMAKK